MATPPEGWKQNQEKPNIYEANISQINIPTGTASIVAETDKTTGSYTVYSTEGINFLGRRTPIYTVSASGALKKENVALYDTLKSQGDISKLDNSIKPKAYQINQTFGTDAEKKTVSESSTYKSLANQATTPAGESGRAPTDKENADIDKDIKSGKSRNEFPGKTGEPLKYPLTLKNEHQDVIKFKMVRYRPRTISNQTGNLLNPVGGRKETLDIIGVVVLPVPSGISDMNAVSWNGGDLNPFEAMGIDIAQSGIIKGMSGLSDSLSGAVQNVQNNAGEAKTAATNAFVQAAMGVSNLLSRTQGAIINPNLELLFQAPTLRPFDFTFKLSARSDKESQAILKIIRFFKQGMSPIRSEANLFLKAPHTFQLEYLHRGQRHKFLNRFKECALTSFSVDYTPEGQYATFTDGAMVSYQIRMQFQELEPIFNDDHENLNNAPDTDIGY